MMASVSRTATFEDGEGIEREREQKKLCKQYQKLHGKEVPGSICKPLFLASALENPGVFGKLLG